MMKSGLIMSCVLGAVAIDLLLSIVGPHQYLNPAVGAFIGEWGMNLSLVFIPSIIILARAPVRSLTFRFALSVLATWFALVEFRMHFGLPAIREMARQTDNHDYDGIGLNAAIMGMGWVPAIIATTFVFLFMPAIVHAIGDDGSG